jgi:hypothetical protein
MPRMVTGFRGSALAEGYAQAGSPCDVVARGTTPTVWSHSASVTVLAGSGPKTLEFEQEVVEILAMEGEAVLAEAAAVIRVAGLGVCLGPFQGPESK